MAVERAIPVLVQVCGALEEAHELGIIHRDLKPENIFLTTSGGMKDFAKVLDFGLAKVTERELRPGSIMLTQEGMVFGTPEFMSPEQAQGLTLDRKSDIYSLATILYEALTGKLPFDARSSMEFIQLHVTKPPIALDDRIPDKSFPPGLGDVIAKALEKDPEKRWNTAADFADALRPYASDTPASAQSATSLAPSPEVAEHVVVSPPPAELEPPTAVTHADTQPQPVPRARTAPVAARTAHAPLSPRTLIIVSAISVLAGIAIAVLALQLWG
jgi:serine/threonine-protein kinase